MTTDPLTTDERKMVRKALARYIFFCDRMRREAEESEAPAQAERYDRDGRIARSAYIKID